MPIKVDSLAELEQPIMYIVGTKYPYHVVENDRVYLVLRDGTKLLRPYSVRSIRDDYEIDTSLPENWLNLNYPSWSLSYSLKPEEQAQREMIYLEMFLGWSEEDRGAYFHSLRATCKPTRESLEQVYFAKLEERLIGRN